MKVDQTMKVLAVLTVVLICWVSTVEPQVPRTRTVTFNVDKAGYNKFIGDLRKELLVGSQQPNGTRIPVLASTSVLRPNNINRYIVVKLIAFSSSVELGLDVTDVYVLGYRPQIGNNSYFLKEIPPEAKNSLFSNTKQDNLSFTGNYISIETKSGPRDQIPLGFQQLTKWVKELNKNTTKETDIAKALVVCIQMVSEAVRYEVIKKEFANLSPNGALKPSTTMQGYQNNWNQLSTAVQTARADGTFVRNVTVSPGLTYSNVNSLIPIISLLKRNIPKVSVTSPLSERNEETLD